ncbi:MAG: hypothetical protein QGF00_12070 [Planctomycetota bacterium]|nr:hypothetical protein [Planctomycetota bacterium]MDP7250330.1 hypothetical protein [Planctomycetota bacterium]
MSNRFMRILISAILLPLNIAWSGELILGGTSGGPKEAQELRWNARFFWGFNTAGAEAAAKWAENTLPGFKKVGVTNFYAYTLSPRKVGVVEEITVGEKKQKVLKTGYSWAGPLGVLWRQIVAERSAWNVPISHNFVPDEIYYNNGHIPYAFGATLRAETPWYPDTPEERKAFKDATGLEFPMVTASRILGGNSRVHRAFILHRYKTLSAEIKSWYALARAKNPKIKTWSIFNLTDVYGLERYPSGFALDMFGASSGIDTVMATAFQYAWDWRGKNTHFYPAETVKHLAAGFPDATVISFPAVYPWAADSGLLESILPKVTFPEPRLIDTLGVALSAVGNGADGFIPFAAGKRKKQWEEQKKTFSMLRDISPWVDGSSVPEAIAVLHSRAGEDWYALSAESKKKDPVADGSMAMREKCTHIQMNNYLSYHLQKARESSRGYRAHKSVMHFLFRNGFSFRLHYLDTLRKQHLLKARVILIPFGHAISETASRILHDAVRDGKKLILFGMHGELSPDGEKHGKALLADLAGQKGVSDFGKEAVLRLGDADVSGKLRAIMDNWLGYDSPLKFESATPECEAAIRVKSPKEKIVFLVNWGTAARKVKLGIPLPEGRYQASLHDSVKIVEAGRHTYSARQRVGYFDLELPALSGRVLYVRPAK